MDRYKIGKGGLTSDPLQQNPRRHRTHFMQWLANCSQTGIVERCALNVVEADDGNVLRNSQALIHKSTNCTYGRDVVVTDQRCKVDPASQQFIRRRKTKLRG